MTDWYEVEEWAGRLWHGWASRATSYPDHPDAAVELDPLRDVLAIYFRALGGPAGVTLSAGRAAGQRHRLGWRQRLGFDREPLSLARFDGDSLILPARIALYPDPAHNRALFFWQVAWLAHARRLPTPADPLQRDLYRLAESRRVTRVVLDKLPGWHGPWNELARGLLQIRPKRRLPPQEQAVEALVLALLGDSETLDGTAAELFHAVARDPAAIRTWQATAKYHPPLPVPLWPNVVTRKTHHDPAKEDDEEEHDGEDGEDMGERKHRAHRRRLDQTERDDPLMINPFEKMISWAEMVNVNRAMDQNKDEEAKKAASELEELTLSRHRKRAPTRLKINLDMAPDAFEEGQLQGEILLPEWHYQRRTYLPDYCAVQVLDAASAAEGWTPDADTRSRIRQVRRQFEALRPRREKLRAQLDGEEFDTDALVRRQAEIAAGHSGSEHIYSRWRDHSRDLAVSILIDASLSTDSWIDERRVIDLEKEALLVLAHGIDACGDQQAIHSFSSHRRKRVEITPLKRFDESLDADIERRIAALEPGRYTRMGAAIRYLSQGLADRPNRHRLMLIISDGKPNDTDHYEGRYALEDTRMAVREARRLGLSVFGVTIDSRARQYIPLIFGRGAYSIVGRAAALSKALPAIYRQLVSH